MKRRGRRGTISGTVSECMLVLPDPRASVLTSRFHRLMGTNRAQRGVGNPSRDTNSEFLDGGRGLVEDTQARLLPQHQSSDPLPGAYANAMLCRRDSDVWLKGWIKHYLMPSGRDAIDYEHAGHCVEYLRHVRHISVSIHALRADCSEGHHVRGRPDFGGSAGPLQDAPGIRVVRPYSTSLSRLDGSVGCAP